jgi:hypothetical protein
LLGTSVVTIAATLAALTAPAAADTTLYTPWSSMLPGWNDQFAPGSDNDCAAGRSSCLNITLNEQTHILNTVGPACSHLAIFPLAYVRMTQTYGWTRNIDGYYQDVRYMNHMDAVFAKYYTDAYYNWSNGTRAAVPQSWLYAFDAAKNKTVSGAGDLFLGMNAHINRDLPVALVDIFTVAGAPPSSDSPQYSDFERVNGLLAATEKQVKDQYLHGVMGKLDGEFHGVDDVVATWSVAAARQAAWTNGEVLWHLRGIDSIERAYLSTLDRTVGFASRGLLVATNNL